MRNLRLSSLAACLVWWLPEGGLKIGKKVISFQNFLLGRVENRDFAFLLHITRKLLFPTVSKQ